MQEDSTQLPHKIINDFCIMFSNVNGTGSSTANTTVMRALFEMGIPVSGRNLFPSNIKGLPTWFTVRVSKDGYLGRVERDHVQVLMNQDTVVEDVKKLVPGGLILYDEAFSMPEALPTSLAFGIPMETLINELDIEKRLRSYVGNMIYVGVLADLLEINLQQVQQAIEFHFKGKTEAAKMNFYAAQRGAEWAQANIDRTAIPYTVEPMHITDGYILCDGNRAASLGTIYGGVQFVSWYPITPASSVIEDMNEFLPMLRKDPETGRMTCAVVQAEDELSALGMIIGAGWGGLRAMTATSGPGLSLMAEYLGLAYFAEVPVVVWDVQRVGPSTGLPTRTAQNDLLFAANISHGDTEQVILMPGSINECFEFGWKAFDIAERLQTPVLILSDLDLGMNPWMGKPFQYPDTPMDRGKVLWEEDIERWTKEGKLWGRYLDVDGDAIPYRTVPGNRHNGATYFTRGTGHDEFARYSEDPQVWEENLARLKRKHRQARSLVPKPIIERQKNARIGVITWGSTHMPVDEARDQLAAKGIVTDYLRVRALPFTMEVTDFLQEHDHTYVVELNRDGQMKELLTLEAPQHAYKLRQLSKVDGLAMTAEWITQRIWEDEDGCHA